MSRISLHTVPSNLLFRDCRSHILITNRACLTAVSAGIVRLQLSCNLLGLLQVVFNFFPGVCGQLL